MINKKNVLGKTPAELGVKDAIHTAIVSVRAGKPVKPGERCGLNEFREAVPHHEGVGVADPFRRGVIATGRALWLLLDQHAVPNVTHVWDHPTVDFSPPVRPVKRNSTLEEIARKFGVTYDQLMDACAAVVETERPQPYPGTKSRAEVEEAHEYWHRRDVFSEWAEETGYEFTNVGTECCPEYEYPRCKLFDMGDAK